jgi:hypothetical protein
MVAARPLFDAATMPERAEPAAYLPVFESAAR